MLTDCEFRKKKKWIRWKWINIGASLLSDPKMIHHESRSMFTALPLSPQHLAWCLAYGKGSMKIIKKGDWKKEEEGEGRKEGRMEEERVDWQESEWVGKPKALLRWLPQAFVESIGQTQLYLYWGWVTQNYDFAGAWMSFDSLIAVDSNLSSLLIGMETQHASKLGS